VDLGGPSSNTDTRLAAIIDEALIDRPNIRIVSANELRQALLDAL
jgi:hypothetical protein